DLTAHGLSREQIAAAVEGHLLTEITIKAPAMHAHEKHAESSTSPADADSSYEVEELKVHQGEHVQAGQALSVLAHHCDLFVEGRAFPQEAPLLREAAEKQRPVILEMPDEVPGDWPALPELKIRFISNLIEPGSQTLAFYVDVPNQQREYTSGGQS